MGNNGFKYQAQIQPKPGQGRFITLMQSKKSTHQKEGINHSHTYTNSSFSQDASFNSKEGPRTKRDKGLKFFTKVGYTKERFKAIPRWCTDM
jgi:hypothetical protein